MSKNTSVVWALAFWLAASGAQAAVIPVTLDNISFDDGATATGFFEFEFTENGLVRLTDFDITTSSGTLPSFWYAPSTVNFSSLNTSSQNTNGIVLAVNETNVVRQLNLNFELGVFSGTGTFPIVANRGGITSHEAIITATPGGSVTRVQRAAVAGAAIRTVVPEPSSFILVVVGTGLLLVFSSLRRLAKRRIEPGTRTMGDLSPSFH